MTRQKRSAFSFQLSVFLSLFASFAVQFNAPQTADAATFATSVGRFLGRTGNDGTGTAMSATGTEFWCSINGNSCKIMANVSSANAVYVSLDNGNWTLISAGWTTGSYAASPELISGASDGPHDIRIKTSGAASVRIRDADGIIVTSGGTPLAAAHSFGTGHYERTLGTLGSTYWYSNLYFTDSTATSAGWTSPSMPYYQPSTATSINWLDPTVEFTVASDVTSMFVGTKSGPGGTNAYQLCVDGTLITTSTYSSMGTTQAYGMYGPITIPRSGAQRRVAIIGPLRVDSIYLNGSGFVATSTKPRLSSVVAWYGDSQVQGIPITSNAQSWGRLSWEMFRSRPILEIGAAGMAVANEVANRAVVAIPTAETTDPLTLTRGRTLTQASSGATFRISRPGILNAAGTAAWVVVDSGTGTPDPTGDWQESISNTLITPSGAPVGRDSVAKDLAPLNPTTIVVQLGGNDFGFIGSQNAATASKFYEALWYQMIDLTTSQVIVMDQMPFSLGGNWTVVTNMVADSVTTVNSARVFRINTSAVPDLADAREDGNHAFSDGFASVMGRNVGAITLTSNTLEGSTITLTDTASTVTTFEFDNNSNVSGANVAVTIGADVGATLATLESVMSAQTGVAYRVLAIEAKTAAVTKYALQVAGVGSISDVGANVTTYSPATTGVATLLAPYIDPGYLTVQATAISYTKVGNMVVLGDNAWDPSEPYAWLTSNAGSSTIHVSVAPGEGGGGNWEFRSPQAASTPAREFDLSAGASASVQVFPSAAANELAVGTWIYAISFNDTTNSVEITRELTLEVPDTFLSSSSARRSLLGVGG